MALERAAHARAKTACLRALEAAILAAGQPCEAFPDGMAVRIDAATVYAPDALVRCGPTLDPDAIGVTDAITVVEVLSPSSRACDSGAKPDDDFLLPSLAH